MSAVTLVPLPLAAEVVAGDDLAAHVLAACAAAEVRLADGDVLCVASKVVAKAEGATTRLPPGADVEQARRALARELAVRVVAETPQVLVVETAHGLVCANAGIDASNVPDAATLLRLPTDPDGAAAALAAALETATGVRPGVLVTDTFGRPWRLGQVDVAIGAHGVRVVEDARGTPDRQGRPLAVTLLARGDAVAGAADLVRGKASGTPFVLVRGLGLAGAGTGAELVRPAAQDLFRHGGATAAAAALAAARDAVVVVPPDGGGGADGEVDVDATALAAVAGAAGAAVLPVGVAVTAGAVVLTADDQLALGTAVGAAAVAAAAHGLGLALTATPGRVTLRLRAGNSAPAGDR